MDPKLSGAKTNPKVNPKNLEKQKKKHPGSMGSGKELEPIHWEWCSAPLWARARPQAQHIQVQARTPSPTYLGLDNALVSIFHL